MIGRPWDTPTLCYADPLPPDTGLALVARIGIEPDERMLARARQRIFVAVVASVLVLGALLTILQPRVYRSVSTVLMTAPTAIDEQLLEADIQGVAIQRRVLLGTDILARLSRYLGEVEAMQRSPEILRELLAVNPVPETNLLELSATGPEPEALPPIVQAWTDVYATVRADDVAERRARTLEEVSAEVEALAAKIQERRAELEVFRAENEIISIERQENAVLARLDGLNKSLNAAIDDEVRARAALQTLRRSVDAGEQVVPEGERGEVAAMADELGRLRAQLAELRARYTDDYIRRDSRLREIPEQIASLESEIGRAYSQGASAAVEEAARELQTAEETVADLERRLKEQKVEVAAFNTIYAEHAAMVEDLGRLEELYREAQARLAQIEARQVDRYPQLSVIDPPAPAALRIGPNYGLWLGGTAIAALLGGIFAVWLHSYLNPRRREPTFVAVTGVPLDYRQSDVPIEALRDERRQRLGGPDPSSDAGPDEDEAVEDGSEPAK